MPPRLARLLAAVVAIALVAGAFVARGALSDDDAESGSQGSDDGSREGDDATTYRVICDEDLGRQACTALGAIPGVEVMSMAGGEVLASDPGDIATYDAWLTLDPMPAVLDAPRELAGLAPLTNGRHEVASGGLSLLEIQGEVACEEVDWPCLVDTADVAKVGLPSLGGSTGLVAAASALLALVPEIDIVGLTSQDEAVADLEVLFARTDDLQDQHTAMVTARGTYAAVVTAAALADRGAERRGTEGFASRRLMPEVTIGIVLAGLGDDGQDAVRALRDPVTEQTVLDALAEGGWTGGAGPTSALPEADLIDALREELG